jgi:hypothetical protein
MRRSNLDKRRDAIRRQAALAGGDKPKIELDLEGLFKLLLGGPPLVTQKEFVYDPAEVKAYMGAAGVAKTSTLCSALWLRALLQPGSRLFVSRNDYNDLMSTTLRRMEEMLARLPAGVLVDRDKSPPMRWWVAPAVQGEPSEITFMGLKDPIVGIEANAWIVDEMNEAEENRIQEIIGRLRAPTGGGDYMLAGAFNPPPKTHWLYSACTGHDHLGQPAEKPAYIKLYKPQPKENISNLPAGYYERMRATMSADLIQRYIDGNWGATFDGKPVYPQFRSEFHGKRGLRFNPRLGGIRFWDYGFNSPFCIFAQQDNYGRLFALAEIVGKMEEAESFITRCLTLGNKWFPEAQEWTDFGDPAAAQKKDTGSTLSVLARLGINLRFRSSTIEYGVDLIRRLLERQTLGTPLLQFDLDKCPVLTDALKGGYRLDKLGEKPKKDGFYDHPSDAYRYGIINLYGAVGNMMPDVSKLPTSVAHRR